MNYEFVNHSFTNPFCRTRIAKTMIGGYTLCSGVICEELNGSDFTSVPFAPDDNHPGETMKVGYITKKNLLLSKVGKIYIEELKRTLSTVKADG